MKSGRNLSIWSGCLTAGIGLGVALSSTIGWGFGMPAGVLIGAGVAMVLERVLSSRQGE